MARSISGMYIVDWSGCGVGKLTSSTPMAYDLPLTPRELAAALNVPVDRIVKLDANESAYGPPPAARAALQGLATDDAVGYYPDANATDLRDMLAAYTGVPADQIVVGNGSDELIELLVGLQCSVGDEVIVCEPTFSMYGLAAGHSGATVASVPLDAAFEVRPEGVLQVISPRARLLFLCGPNNPTGTVPPAASLVPLLDRGPVVVVDEAYHEYARASGVPSSQGEPPGSSLATRMVREGHPLVVLRTFSKAFGLAGLRVGYALCPPQLARRLRGRKAPYNVNVAALRAAKAALTQCDWIYEKVVATVHEREALARRLGTLPGMRVYPSAGNFLLIEWTHPQNRDRAIPLWRNLQLRGILVRHFEHPRLSSCVRVTVGTRPQNGVLLEALAECLGTPETLL